MRYRTDVGTRLEQVKPILETQRADETWVAIAYAESPYMFHMLRYVIGDHAFFAALKGFKSRLKNEAAPVEEFEQLAEEAYGSDLDWFFKQWLRQVVVPDYNFGDVTVDTLTGGFVINAVVRNRGTGRMPVQVAVCAAGDTLTQQVILEGGQESAVRFATSQVPVRLEVDPHMWVLQSDASNDVYVFQAEETLERLSNIGFPKPGQTDKEAIIDLIQFYQREDIDGASAATLWDFEAQARFTGGVLSHDELVAIDTKGKNAYGQFPRGTVIKDVSVTSYTTRAGVSEGVFYATLWGPVTGDVRYNLRKSEKGRWRFVYVALTISPAKPYVIRLKIGLAQVTGGATIANRQLTVKAGSMLTLSAEGIRNDSSTTTIASTWRVIGNIGTITPAGRLTAGTKAGVWGSVVVAAEGIRDTLRVTVLPAAPQRLIIKPDSVRLTPGQQLVFRAEGVDSFNNTIRNLRVFWHTVGGIGTIHKSAGIFKAGSRPGTGYVIVFAGNASNSVITEGAFGDIQAKGGGSAKVIVEQELPTVHTLSQNYPNPFNPATTISYELPDVTAVRLAVYDLSGQVIRILVDGYQQPGRYAVVWDGRDGEDREVATGIYSYRLEAIKRGFVETKRMLLLR